MYNCICREFHKNSTVSLLKIPNGKGVFYLLQLESCTDMVIRVFEFSSWETKLERFLPKNQHTQRKLLNFENWVNGGGVKNWTSF